MNLHAIGIVYRKEFTEWIRDRRTLISTVLVPLLAFPLLMVGSIYVATNMLGKAQKEKSKVMLIGDISPNLRSDLEKNDGFAIVPYDANWKNAISDKQIQAAVEVPKDFDASLESGASPVVEIYYYEGELKSSIGASHLEKFLGDYRDGIVKNRLTAKNLPASILTPFEVKKDNVAPPEKVSGATIGGFIGYIVIILCMTGAMYPAIDLTAGEKERGTMETILSSPISRVDLVIGKFFLVFSASLATAILAVLSMGVSFTLAAHGNLSNMSHSDAQSLALHVGWASVATVFLMALPLAILFSAALMTIALFAKSYKEAQSYLTPMTFLIVIPAVASILPGVELTPKLALVPVLSTSLVCKEIISGTYHWNSIGLIFASTCVYAAAAIFLAVKTFQREEVIFRS
jgi:sodium transport system permease protein